ncbi:MAG: hypothetical protein ACI8W8_003699 [Rhodothermales bacterium]|jgi:hypothetical protein
MRGTDGMGGGTPAEFGARIGAEEYWLRWIRNTVDGSFTQSAATNEAVAQSGGKDDNMLILSNGGDFFSSASLTIDVLKDPDSTAAWSRAAVTGLQIVPAPNSETISVNFHESDTYIVTGSAGHSPAASWNNFKTDNSTSPKILSLFDGNGDHTPTWIGVDSQAGWQEDVNLATQSSTMQSSYWDTGGGGFGTDGQITINNVPLALKQKRYFVILYMRGTDSMGPNTPAEFGARIGAEEYWTRWMRNGVEGRFTQSAYTDEPSAQSSGKDNNMLVFTNGGAFYADSSLTIDVLKDPDAAAAWARAAVTGVQLVAVPESQIFSVNFHESDTYTVTGSAGNVAASNWNNFKTDNSASPKILSLLDGNGDVSGARVGVDSQAGWQANVSTATQSSTMESSYWDTGGGGFGTDGQIIINSIPLSLQQGGYYVILYVRGTDGMGAGTPAEFGARVGGEEYWLRWIRDTVDGSFSQSTYGSEALAQSSGNDDNLLILNRGGAYFNAASLTIDVLKDPDAAATWSRAAVTGLQVVGKPPATVIRIR